VFLCWIIFFNVAGGFLCSSCHCVSCVLSPSHSVLPLQERAREKTPPPPSGPRVIMKLPPHPIRPYTELVLEREHRLAASPGSPVRGRPGAPGGSVGVASASSAGSGVKSLSSVGASVAVAAQAKKEQHPQSRPRSPFVRFKPSAPIFLCCFVVWVVYSIITQAICFRVSNAQRCSPFFTKAFVLNAIKVAVLCFTCICI